MTNKYSVKWAAWGGQAHAGSTYVVADITAQLQSILDSGTTYVTFDGSTIPDPLHGVSKGWAIRVNINGKDYYYAGIDSETVDFTVLPTNSVGRSKLSVSNVSATLVRGGWPTPVANYLFSACSFTITNNTGAVYPPPGTNGVTSSWVSVDCYLSTSNSPNQPISQLVRIGDIAVNVGTLQNGNSIPINVAILSNGLFNMGRDYTGNPKLLPSRGSYYLYIQVRTSNGILLNEGCFSTKTFAPKPPQ